MLVSYREHISSAGKIARARRHRNSFGGLETAGTKSVKIICKAQVFQPVYLKSRPPA